jgi:hypothetical protein
MNGRPSWARSTTSTSKLPWAVARAAIQRPLGSPARSGRVLAMMI